jgi:hypothetical protein
MGWRLRSNLATSQLCNAARDELCHDPGIGIGHDEHIDALSNQRRLMRAT